MSTFFHITFAHAAVLATALVGLGEDHPSPVENKLRAIALIQTITNLTYRPAIGTGFLINPPRPLATTGTEKCWMITNAHVVKNAIGIRVDFSSSESRKVLETYVDDSHDIALLLLDSPAAPNAEAFDICGREKHELVQGEPNLRMMGYSLGFTPARIVPAALTTTLSGANLAGAELAPDTEVFEVQGIGERGASGSVLTGPDGTVVGVYCRGFTAARTRANVGYCISYKHINGLAHFKKTLMDRRNFQQLDKLSNFIEYSLIRSSNQHMRDLLGDIPFPTRVVGTIQANDAFERFFHSSRNSKDNQQHRMVNEYFKSQDKHFNHVVNITSGFGILIPEKYEFADSYDDEIQAFTFIVRRPHSLYKMRLYSRVVPDVPIDVEKRANTFAQETMTFLSHVPKVMAVEPGKTASRPGEVTIGPGSWPALYKEKQTDDLMTLRVYDESAQGLIHIFEFSLDSRFSRFQVAGISFPAADAANATESSDEFKELWVMLASVYDLELGVERTNQLRSSESLVEVYKLPTPTPEAKPNNVIGELGNELPPVPAAEKQNPVIINPPRQNEVFAKNLGAHYELVRLPDGTVGARLTRHPQIGTPLANVKDILGNISHLEIGDIIVDLDGMPIESSDSVETHFGVTTLTVIDVRTQMVQPFVTSLP